MNIVNLPREVLSEVFSHLPDHELPKASSTCQYFNKIFNNEVLWNLNISKTGLNTKKYKNKQPKYIYKTRIFPIKKITTLITESLTKTINNCSSFLDIKSDKLNKHKIYKTNLYSQLLEKTAIDIKNEQHKPYKIISSITDNLSNKDLTLTLKKLIEQKQLNISARLKMTGLIITFLEIHCNEKKIIEIIKEISYHIVDHA